MTAHELAVRGGPKMVPERWPYLSHRLRRGITRSLDLLAMLPLTARGVTSISDGAGIVGRFERGMCELTGAKHALGMNSGTASLHSAYFAVGVGPGTEVIVPAYTWHASATPVIQCGAVPVFCEIDPRTLTIDPDDVERRITERTRAICAVHVWGNPAPMDRILEIAGRHGLSVIEDCSHAHGSRYASKAVGSWGDVGCFSLQGSKIVEGGEGGVAVTDDDTLYDRMCLLGHNMMVMRGQRGNTFPDYGDVSLGVKYRPHPAAMFLAKASLDRLAPRNRRARRAWGWIQEEVAGRAGLRPIEQLPGSERGGNYAFVLEYTGEALGGPSTEEFVKAVQAEGAPLGFDQYRGRLLHTLKVFTELDRRTLGGGCWDATRPWEENLVRTSLPVTESLVERLVKFPPYLYDVPERHVRRCARALAKVHDALVLAGAAATAGDQASALAAAPDAARSA